MYDPSRSPHRSDVERLSGHLLAHTESHPDMTISFKGTPLELRSEGSFLWNELIL